VLELASNMEGATTSLFYGVAATIIAVVCAYIVSPSSIFVVALVMVVVSVVFPFLVLFAIGNSHNQTTSVVELATKVEWHLMLAPLITAVCITFIIQHITRRLRPTPKSGAA